MSHLKAMSTPRISSKLILAGISALVMIPSAVTALPKAAEANQFCQCTKYVANKVGLSQNFVDAKDWNDAHPRYGGRSYLAHNGLRPVGARPGAVVVMEASFPGANATYGHVGIVERVETTAGRTYIHLRGANQSGSRFLDAGCNNATVIRFGTPINGRGDISFWSR